MDRQRCASPHAEHGDVRCELVGDHAGSHYHYSPAYVLTSWRDSPAPELHVLAVDVPDEVPALVEAPALAEPTPGPPAPLRTPGHDDDVPPVSASSILAGWGRTGS